jgi:hypothetical protein
MSLTSYRTAPSRTCYLVLRADDRNPSITLLHHFLLVFEERNSVPNFPYFKRKKPPLHFCSEGFFLVIVREIQISYY